MNVGLDEILISVNKFCVQLIGHLFGLTLLYIFAFKLLLLLFVADFNISNDKSDEFCMRYFLQIFFRLGLVSDSYQNSIKPCGSWGKLQTGSYVTNMTPQPKPNISIV